MIGAPEELAGVSSPVNDDFRALMRATVQQHMDVAGGMTHLNDRLGADMGAEIIALVRGLAFVPDKHPSIGEQVLHLEPVDLLIDIDVPMDFAATIQSLDRSRIVCIAFHCHLP